MTPPTTDMGITGPRTTSPTTAAAPTPPHAQGRAPFSRYGGRRELFAFVLALGFTIFNLASSIGATAYRSYYPTTDEELRSRQPCTPRAPPPPVVTIHDPRAAARFIFVAIVSQPRSFARRRYIREGWLACLMARAAQQRRDASVNGSRYPVHVVYRFFIRAPAPLPNRPLRLIDTKANDGINNAASDNGRANSGIADEFAEELAAEAAANGNDVVTLGGGVDSYANLTLKVHSMLGWVAAAWEAEAAAARAEFAKEIRVYEEAYRRSPRRRHQRTVMTGEISSEHLQQQGEAVDASSSLVAEIDHDEQTGRDSLRDAPSQAVSSHFGTRPRHILSFNQEGYEPPTTVRSAGSSASSSAAAGQSYSSSSTSVSSSDLSPDQRASLRRAHDRLKQRSRRPFPRRQHRLRARYEEDIDDYGESTGDVTWSLKLDAIDARNTSIPATVDSSTIGGSSGGSGVGAAGRDGEEASLLPCDDDSTWRFLQQQNWQPRPVFDAGFVFRGLRDGSALQW